MSRLSFRARLLFALLVMSAVPLAVMSVGTMVLAGDLIGPRDATSDLARARARVDSSAKTMLDSLAPQPLTPGANRAVAQHQQDLDTWRDKEAQTEFVRGAFEPIFRWSVIAIALFLLVAAGFLVRTLSRQFAAPLQEIVAWTGRIRRQEPLPPDAPDAPAIPEFMSLRHALRDLAQGLEQARAAELEAERLRAFGEVARRVAHEMKNPLTPIRLAVSQLRRTAPPEQQESLEVIAIESARLEAMAREFAELGRLPEGIAATVDLRELLEDLLRSAVPEAMVRRFHAETDRTTIEGYYDPLRRAFSNLLRNAVEACRGDGAIAVTMHRAGAGLEIRIADDGPGVPLDRREVIFRPYYTDKGDGTGLGLAIVRQTIEQHRGTIIVGDTPGGGATFLVRFAE